MVSQLNWGEILMMGDERPLEVFSRFSLERCLTARMAKVIRLILIDEARRSFLRIHRHFADRIDSYEGFRGSKARF
jgi:hypothetical protein